VWDIRMDKEVHAYFPHTPANCVRISDTGLLGLGYGSHVNVWQDALVSKQVAPYLVHELPGRSVRGLEFCPFQDVLGISHNKGFESIIVPGAGEANFDTFEANPMESKDQRRERVVHTLLEKLNPNMIALEQSKLFGVMSREGQQVYQGDRKAMREARAEQAVEESMKANKKRGRNKPSKRVRRRKANIVDKNKLKRKEDITKKKTKREEEKRTTERLAANLPAKSALDRFK
jgi:U3 small nucleolar RNA-associated protein 7